MKTGYLPTHHRAAVVTVFLVLFLLAGCATTGVNRGDVNLVSVEEEWQLGAQLEQDIAKQMQLVNDPTARSYINEMGQRIVRQTELGNLPWEFYIVADPSLNAFNIPGGRVYVHTGMIAAADNAAELAGVMAHEIAHGVARHGTERLTKAYGLNIGAALLLGQNPAVYEQILAQIIGTGAIAKFSRDDEREADELGIRYMYEAGYDPEGMPGMFQKLLDQGGGSSNAIAQFFATHPQTQARINDSRRRAQRMPDKPGLITNDGQLAEVKQRVSRYNR